MEFNRMNTQKLASAIALSGLSATSLYAAQPPTASSVLSDGFYNTTMGPASLSHITPPNRQCSPYALNASTPYMSGCGNTASGFAALDQNTTGYSNTADGAGALFADTNGYYNTSVGTLSMFRTTSGKGNAAFGGLALFSNTTGSYNLASGSYSLLGNTTGNNNTGAGISTLYFNTSGSNNTASGINALTRNTVGNYNTGSGAYALYANTTGTGNVGLGAGALYNSYNATSFTGSSYNVAVGYLALFHNTTANAAGNNTAVGYYSLYNNAAVNNSAFGSGALSQATTGNGNTAVGVNSGYNLTSGSYNTYIGYNTPGIAATDNFVTQIGVFSKPSAFTGTFAPTAYIAGVSTSVITGAAVYVTASGQLGVLASAERYKTDIASLGPTTDKLAQLRPVSFHLKSEPNGAVQYGLIAEEVNKVYPELVIRDKEGNIQGVRYDELAPMLLNEMQKEQTTIAAQATEIQSLEAQNAETRKALAELNDLKNELNAALHDLKSKDKLTAQR
jgi:trimeric autotransporter adhesin